MQTLKLNQKNFKKIAKITVKSIKQRKVVIFPTDTVYIPAADATSKKAVEKVFKIKKSDQGR